MLNASVIIYLVYNPQPQEGPWPMLVTSVALRRGAKEQNNPQPRGVSFVVFSSSLILSRV